MVQRRRQGSEKRGKYDVKPDKENGVTSGSRWVRGNETGKSDRTEVWYDLSHDGPTRKKKLKVKLKILNNNNNKQKVQLENVRVQTSGGRSDLSRHRGVTGNLLQDGQTTP